MSATKITAEHLRRRAVVYVRQSTPGQVVDNRESQRLQYGLRERALQLGFADVDVIDDDLGRSGSGLTHRPGFERLVAMVCAATVGAVFCFEASRLARNGRDWHHLLDFCALVGALIIDPEGTYDPRLANDRLLLGLKGTMSEFELSVFRQRSFEAKRAKAKRGELRFRLPIGLRWAGEGVIEMDPDLRVREAIGSVFDRFERLGSIRQVLLAIRRDGITLPTAVEGERDAPHVWKLPVYNTLHKLLTNALYAGAYVYGKTEARTRVVGDRGHKSFGHRKEISAWTVLIRDHHRGYITWEQYERNQRVVADNAHMRKRLAPKAGRGGRALLGGLIRCRRCGRILHVTYGGRRQPGARYDCRGANVNHGTSERCIAFGGLRVDEAISRVLLDAISPGVIQAAVDAAERKLSERSDAHRALALELTQAQYDAKLARRRYDAVDPDNRLVAGELERRWNEALRHAGDIESRIAETTQRDERDRVIDRGALTALADALPAVWNSASADMRLKQRIVRILVREIVADVDVARSEIVLLVHWQGGRHSELRLPKKRTGEHGRVATPTVEEVVRRMAGRWSSEDIAATLNRMRTRTGTGKTWNESRVEGLRKRLDLPAFDAAKIVVGETMTLNEAVEHLGVSNGVVLRLMREGLLQAKQAAPHAPYEITRESLDRPQVIAAARSARTRGAPARRWAADRKTLLLPGVEDPSSAK